MNKPLLGIYFYPWDTLTDTVYWAEDATIPWTLSSIVKHAPRTELQFSGRREGRLDQKGNRWLLSMPNGKTPLRMTVRHELEEQTYQQGAPAWLTKWMDGGKKKISDTPLYKTVVSWSAFFDECLFEDTQPIDDAPLSWKELSEIVKRLQDNTDEPQMSLIVHMANELTPVLQSFAAGLRKVLTRDRRMLPVDKAEEFDGACLDWYIRQPGLSAAEKAAFNQQKLKAVARKEFVNTLENRVLKDFLIRCCTEADVYRSTCKRNQLQSQRARKVQAFGRLCATLLALPVFDQITAITGVVQPNYVLPGDPRYRKVWRRYCQLLRKQRVYDQLWNWQSRLWIDAVSLMLSVALERIREDSSPNPAWRLDEIATGLPQFYSEQHDGLRMARNSMQGPFILRTPDNKRLITLDVIAAGEFEKYLSGYPASPLRPLIDALGGAGFIFRDLDRQRQTLVFFWPVHMLAAGEVTPDDCVRMQRSLESLVQDRLPPKLMARNMKCYAMALLSDHEPELNFNLEQAMTVRLGASVADWSMNVDLLKELLEQLLDKMLK